ncbi:DUF1785 domain containing protein [Musa troglodytarum]|uniref:DUF1785 domain containing protein n=1 Tax=Musa troglodytarum TaxID=320322 RepID=A0A9E7I1X1_9LILI|nr:DUF1785 domain containing protein [Musa troglodytarum]URE39587.1 DUF1785 domain containing protein [Musa troglodytarum]URE39588.1 DUF1785 domain containing protein [Musa troglodytarum]
MCEQRSDYYPARFGIAHISLHALMTRVNIGSDLSEKNDDDIVRISIYLRSPDLNGALTPLENYMERLGEEAPLCRFISLPLRLVI